MFIPNIKCKVYKCNGYNQYGEEKFAKPFLSMCAIVKLKAQDEKTTVRSDVGASKSHAIEENADAKILFRPNVNISKGDKIEILGFTIRITANHPRLNIYGKLDHIEYDGMME